MNINLKNIRPKITAAVEKLQQYSVFIFIIVILLIFGFLVFRINVLTRAEPSEDAVTEKLSSIKRPKIDQSAIDKIQQLQDNSTEVQTLFKDARNNPFQE